MSKLEDLSLRKRILVAVIIVLLSWFLLRIGSRIFGADAEAEPFYLPSTSKWEAQILAIDKEAIEKAYAEQIRNLFIVWMKDSTGQPERAISGARKAEAAYIGAMEALEKRGLKTTP